MAQPVLAETNEIKPDSPSAQYRSDLEASWRGCPVQTDSAGKASGVISTDPYPDAIYLEANAGTLRESGLSQLLGSVILQQNELLFQADSLSFDRTTQKLNASGNVRFRTPDLLLKSPALDYNLATQSGSIQQASYQIGTIGARGNSRELIQVDKNNLVLKGADFTTCPPGINSWSIASSRIHLNKQTRIGQARNLRFKVGSLPVFYFPWFRFPLDNQRLSGFLTPSLRLQKDAGITLPYYFNLAPNYDATVSYSSLSGRGYRLGSQLRYLTTKHSGSINYEIIPKDKTFDNQKRDFFRIKHKTDIGKKTVLNLKAEGVSDPDYFDSSGESLEISTTSALERRLEIIHDHSPFRISAALEDYQVLDTNDFPYSRLPEIKLTYDRQSGPRDLKVKIEAETTFFERKDSVTGNRFDVGLRATRRWGTDAWFFKPSAKLNHTLYNLNNATSDSTLQRTLPTLSLDGGLFFDRTMRNSQFTQTLEPRLFYTYTPYKDQTGIPVFDTALTDFSTTSQLFAENRFTGKDRIADTNQLTFAVTSRIQDRVHGKELFRASIGQIYNFEDRRVTLPGGMVETGNGSELVLELSGRLGDRLRVATLSLYNPETNRPSLNEIRLNYRNTQENRVANLSYREVEKELRQVSATFSTPISERWSLVGGIDHDLKKDRNLEALAGVEYRNCCWKTRLVAKRYLTADNKTYDNPIYLEFELKGLGNIGTSATRELQEKIYGYND